MKLAPLLSGILFSVLISSTSLAQSGNCGKTQAVPSALNSAAAAIIQQKTGFDPYARRLATVYAACGFQPLWTDVGELNQPARRFMAELRGVGARGLDTSAYALDAIDRAESELASMKTAQTASTFDMLLTSAAMLLVHDLQCGVVKPATVGADLSDHCSVPGMEGAIWALVRGEDGASLLNSVEPQAPGYQRAKAAIAEYKKLVDSRIELQLPDNIHGPQAGELPASEIFAFLQVTGDAPASSTDKGKSPDTDKLVDAIRSFQQRHGLVITGKLNDATVRAMRVPFSERVEQLALTLERWRWVARSFAQPPVVVNVPEFKLRAYDESLHVKLSMKVIVGGAYRKQTPVFENEISSVIFRPYWNVPESIQQKEIMPKVKRDPGYLARNGFEMVKQDGRLRVRQKPGDQNALGLIKFSLPNNYNVYLHGTPMQHLFEKTRRDFSHGCIRVESPVDLARWALRYNEGWTEEAIIAAMHGTPNHAVPLAHKIPVLIVYGTGFAGEDGKVYFLPDIYSQDEKLKSVIASEIARRNTEAHAFVKRAVD